MSILPLVYTQLIPPRIKNVIIRHRLAGLSQQILDHRITTVIAPAGSGKSIWVSSLVEEPAWPTTAWLSIDSHDAEPSYLLFHLIHAIMRILPDFGEQALLTLKSLENPGRDWHIGISSIIEELPPHKEIILVLDDFHLIQDSQAACGIVNHLIRWLPTGMRLIIISRHQPPLKMHREKLSDELLEVGSAQLAFSLDEARDMLAAMGLELEDRDLAAIHNRTEGWAVGLRLIGMFLRETGGDLEKTLSALNRDDSELYTYLATETLNRLPQDRQDFLLDSALLPYMDAELCNATLQCQNSAAILSELHAYGILNLVEGDNLTWRLHHLVKDYFARKVKELRSPDYITGLMRRAAIFLEKKGDIDRALDQAVAGGDWALTAELLNRHGYSYFMYTARLDALSAWINRLPERLVAGDHGLLQLKGMSMMQDDTEGALATLSTAADMAAEKGDVRCQVRSLLAMSWIYNFTNNMEKIEETANRIPVAAALLKDSWSRGMVLAAALGRDAWGDNLQRGLWLSRLTGQLNLDPEVRMSYLFMSCIIHYRLGNLAKARALIEEALDLPYVRENERWTGTALVLLSAICVFAGDYKKLSEVSAELLRLGRKYNIPYQTAYGHRRLARLHQRESRLAEAQREYELSRIAFIEANNSFGAELSKLDLIMLRITNGENARDLLAETGEILKNLAAFPGGQELNDYALSLAGVVAMEAGDFALARARLEEVAANCSRKGAAQVLAGSQLLLARVCLLQGDEKKADHLLNKALGAAEAGEWEDFWDWHDETVYTMFRRALQKDIHPNWAARMLHLWFPERIYREAGYLLTSTDVKLRNFAMSFIRDNACKSGAPVIHACYLGGFRVFVNGAEINQSQWKTQKAANLFKLLTTSRSQLRKDVIIEQLWPASASQSGDASLRMALSHVRKALGFNESGHESVLLKRGMVFFNPEIELYTDFELFDSTAQNTMKNTDNGNPAVTDSLVHAVELYTGRFLPENVYDDWSSALRSHLHRLYLDTLLKLIDTHRHQGNYTAAVKDCRLYLSYEPADEQVGRMAMEFLLHLGEKQQALSLFREITAALAKEYDAAPAPETQAVYERIRCN